MHVGRYALIKCSLEDGYNCSMGISYVRENIYKLDQGGFCSQVKERPLNTVFQLSQLC